MSPVAPPTRTQLCWAVILHRGSCLLLAGYDTFVEAPNTLRGLDQFRHSQMAWDWHLQLQTVSSLSELKTNIRNGHGYIVSDGSYCTVAGAAAWNIKGCSANSWVIGMMLTPGSPKDHSSFRSELAGIYGALCTLESLELGKVLFHCRFACDGKSALDRLKSTHPILPTEPHADLLQAIKSKEAQAGLTVHWCHVKGHQDGKTPTVLSRYAWLNIEADLLAKAMVNLEHHSPTQYRLPGEGWICCINQHRVVKQLADTIRGHINEVPADKYWKQKLKMSKDTWQLIDWYGVGRTYWELTTTVRRWATKHTLGFLHMEKIWRDGISTRQPAAHVVAMF